MSAETPVIADDSLPVQSSPKKGRSGTSAWSGFFQDPRAATGFGLFMVFVILAVFAPVIAPYHPEATTFATLLKPSRAHLFGTTSLGQDVFSQFVWGARTTTVVGIGAGLLSTLIAILIGVTAGYRGGVTDSILNTITNIFLVLPGLALLIIIESYVNSQSPYTNGLIIGVTGWAWGARVMRSMAMTVGSRDYIAAARLAGASTFRIIYAEIVPNMTSVIASNIMYACLGAILAESGLAYLGFEGMTSTSWGAMLYLSSQNGAMMVGAWWWFIPPGLGIAMLGLSFALMNFGVDQVTNPRLRRAKRSKAMRAALKQLREKGA
ncbi:ABC transporter permease [Alicyclobacillus sp. ALC3]|uniref:ABC transporter permease n=1 Tax=Alicyclobacillus sp. ALC3 TaxID=2796143 RepID=UPI0023793084|nr:ABC transporter permease [Alicyclobacillus sp. ALC3]